MLVARTSIQWKAWGLFLSGVVYKGTQPRKELELEQRVEEAVLDINLQGYEKPRILGCSMPHRFALVPKKVETNFLID